MAYSEPQTAYTAWQPGIQSELPKHLRAYDSLYQPGCSSINYAQAMDLHRLTGIRAERLAAFTWQRLILHELVVRVTADIVVPEGDDEEILGRRFRGIIDTIQTTYVEPHTTQLRTAHEQLKQRVSQDVGQLLDRTILDTPEQQKTKSGWRRWFGHTPKRPSVSIEEQQFNAIKQLREQGLQEQHDYQATVYKSMYVVLSAVATHRGRLPHDRELFVRLISHHMMNDYGSRHMGRLLEPMVAAAIIGQNYQPVENTDKPILISLKGASAAGKSTLRPLLYEDMVEHDLANQNFATISPDIWRRLLLDYASLGEDFKYSGRLTSHEVNIIDGKLDRYIRAKAEHLQAIPNLLVDRFRFDSFNSKKIADVLHSTYVHYVDTMHMYFVITPPEATVERGWLRGQERGRYKSVEDFLGHSVEAYEGMPRLFFKWIAYTKPHYKYHFVDNDVPKGTAPRLVAWGDQNAMTIIDPLVLSNIDRYQKINIHAPSPAEVYPQSRDMDIANNCQFLQQCLRTLPLVKFAVSQDTLPYLQFAQNSPQITDSKVLQQVREQPQLASLLAQLMA